MIAKQAKTIDEARTELRNGRDLVVLYIESWDEVMVMTTSETFAKGISAKNDDWSHTISPDRQVHSFATKLKTIPAALAELLTVFPNLTFDPT